VSILHHLLKLFFRYFNRVRHTFSLLL